MYSFDLAGALVNPSSDAPFSHVTRAENLAAMAKDPVDLLVIGAGITGAGIARDAAMRGLRTAVIDKGDFGSGTSSHSSRLIHGGLRYLEMADFRLVFEACRERRTLLRIAPHLVWPQPFVFPIHKDGRLSMLKLAAGLTLYDILALFRNVKRHRMMGKKATLRAEPNLRTKGLKGGGLYYDARCNDARLTLATVRSAHRHGALAVNYARVDDFERAEGQIRGARVRDVLNNHTLSVHAKVVVNATGPWSDRVREHDGGRPVLRGTKGVHVAVKRERIGNQHALALTSPIDGRVMFVIPSGSLSYIGTTDTDDSADPDTSEPTAEDVVYLLRSANAFFPDARLGPADVVSAWSGIRPLVKPEDSRDPSAVSREHRILESDSGLVSIVGGKLTSYRAMAAEVVDRVAEHLHEIDGRQVPSSAPTDTEPLPGGETADTKALMNDVVREGFELDPARYLVHCCGAEAAAVVRLAQAEPALAKPVAPTHPAVRALIVYAIRREMAMRLSDLMIRRTNLFYEVIGHAVPEAGVVAELAAQELGWDRSQTEAELAAYSAVIDRTMSFREELGG